MGTRPETKAVLEELGRLVRELTRRMGGAEEGPAMTASQRIALIELGDDEPLRLNDLAARMGTSPPTASRAVDALESLGLVTRAPDPSDRRALHIELSADGRAFLDERLTRATAAFAPAATSLTSDELRTALGLLERMTAALRTDR